MACPFWYKSGGLWGSKGVRGVQEGEVEVAGPSSRSFTAPARKHVHLSLLSRSGGERGEGGGGGQRQGICHPGDF